MVGVFILLLPLMIALERRRIRRAEERFLRGRQPLSDDAFLARAGATADEAAFFLATRRAMARLSGIEPEMVHPEDTWRSLMDLQWDAGFMEDIVFELETELGENLPLAYPGDDKLTVAAYTRELAKCLDAASNRAKR
jgi:hypothetical protein